MISAYQYGDLIHWGNDRDNLSKLIGESEFEDGLTKIQFLQAVAALSHLYVGFGFLINSALAEPPR